MKWIHRTRLKMLASFLTDNAAIRSHFDLDTWADNCNGLTLSAGAIRECGTAACAVGWAGALKRFKIQGFRINRYMQEEGFEPAYKHHRNWAAVTEFFGLEENEAMWLFMAEHYRPSLDDMDLDDEGNDPRPRVTPDEVASRIRLFISQKEMST